MIEVIAVSAGNITFIGSGEELFITEARFKKATDEDVEAGKEIVEINGEPLVFGEGKFENDTIKYVKENYMKLLHYTIARTASQDVVNLVIDIPGGQYNAHHKKMKEKIMDNNVINLKIDGKMRNIVIADVWIQPEGYASFKVAQAQNLGADKLIDNTASIVLNIGGGTSDIVLIDENGKYDRADSIHTGLLDLYDRVVSELEDKHDYYKVTIEDAKEYFRGKKKSHQVKGTAFKTQPINDTFDEIYNDLKRKVPDVGHRNMYLIGGGAEVFGNKVAEKFPQVISITDITIDAKSMKVLGGAREWSNQK
ncbi:MAG: ParM/StbA family protein [Clostridium sp.]|uniref:ParM/StbA family protein n=1 Tax=Clostridium sp. TaxID=1506 RepID=UPI003F374E19